MKQRSHTRPRTAFGRIFADLVQRYTTHDVARDSAALTYYLLFAIFPLLIFISALVGMLGLNLQSTMLFLDEVLPAPVADTVENYLEFVTRNPSRNLMIFSMVFSIWFPMRATNCLTHSIRKAFGQTPPASALRKQFGNFLFSLWLILSISVSLFLILVGRRLLEFVGRFITISPLFITLWTNLRFVVLALVMMVLLAVLYMLAQGSRCPLSRVLPGILFSLCTWLLLSGAFALYVERVAHYAELYGSIATVVVVLLWLYISATMLIIGAEFNGALLQYQQEKHASPKEE